MIAIALISTSTVLNLLCWFCPKLATSFIYLESLWIIYDTIYIEQLNSESHYFLILIFQCVRFIAAGMLLGVYTRQTLLTVTLGVILAQISLKFIVQKEQIDEIGMFGAVLIVFSIVTGYFMSVHREAELRHTIASLAEERD